MAIDGLRTQAVCSGKVIEVEDPDEIAGLIADGKTRVWIDLTDPSPALVEKVARLRRPGGGGLLGRRGRLRRAGRRGRRLPAQDRVAVGPQPS
jgi:hypothetical protein